MLFLLKLLKLNPVCSRVTFCLYYNQGASWINVPAQSIKTKFDWPVQTPDLNTFEINWDVDCTRAVVTPPPPPHTHTHQFPTSLMLSWLNAQINNHSKIKLTAIIIAT